MPGGVFCGQFFGPNDEWAPQTESICFHSRDEIMDLSRGLEVLLLRETEENGPGRATPMKHWHVFDLIAQRNESS